MDLVENPPRRFRPRSLWSVRFGGLAGEAGWVAAGQLMTAVGGLVGMRLLTEVLPPKNFGALIILLGFASLAFDFSTRQIMQAAMRFRAEYADEEGARILRTESLRVMRWMLSAVCAILIVAFVLWRPDQNLPFWIGLVLAALVLADTARTYETGLLNAARRQKALALWQAADAWARPLVAVSLVLAVSGDAQTVLIGYALATSAICLLFARTLTLEGKAASISRADADGSSALPDHGRRRAEIRQRIFTFILPLFPVAGLAWITAVGDRYIIAGMLDLQAAGLYAAIYGVVSRPFLMAGEFLDTWLRPRLYEAVTHRDTAASWRTVGLWSALATGIGGSGVICFLLLHDAAAALLLAKPYRDASHLMPWIALGYAIVMVSQVALRLCFAHHRTSFILLTRIVIAVATVAVMIPMIARYGLWGAAVAAPIYFSVQLAFSCLMAAIAVRAASPNAGKAT